MNDRHPTPPTPAHRSTGRAAATLALALASVTTLGVVTPSAAAPTATTAPMQRVVVTGASSLADLTRAVESAGGKVLSQLSLIGAIGAELPAGAELPIPYTVVPDREMHVAATSTAKPTDVAVSTIRETLGLAPSGTEGRGVTVAVVDTGVEEGRDLRGRVTHVDVSQDSSRPDGYGHGTFVAGLIAGNGRSSNGAYTGIAPRADILDVKVAGDSGESSLIDVLEGLQAVADHREVDVLNLSLSSGSPLPYAIDPLTQALEKLWSRGVTVVVPAGNDGDRHGTLGSPGIDPVLLTVGGLDESGTARRRDDTVADWSSRGGRGQRNPDLVAPGKSVVSLLSPGSAVAGAQTRSNIPAGYGAGSGTSFSTAVTSGAAAALVAERRLRPDQVKALLTETAYRGPGLRERRAAGAGGLDLSAALAARTPKVDRVRYGASVPPGQDRKWQALFEAFSAGDRDAAYRAWARLDKQQQAWAASNWGASNWGASNWGASNWGASNWAASNWAASNWAASNWAASNWAAADWR